MNVLLKKGHLDYFRKKARNSPNEQLAYLLGSADADTVTVDRFFYPRLVSSTPIEVEALSEDIDRIYAQAQREGIVVVGSIHSHPNWIPVLSHTDYEGHLDCGDLISGVVGIDSERRTRPVFWTAHSALPCDVLYI